MNSMKLLALPCAVLLLGGSSVVAQSPDDVVRIEEFWELDIREPDVASVAPQVTNSFAPVQQGDILYATFNINHHLLQHQEFAAGGLQLQLWHGDQLLATKTSDKKGLLATPGEVIKWKQVISVCDGVVKFSVLDGTSQTFGTFGGSLSLTVLTNLTSLNNYRPNDSISHSGTVYAANRVNSLRLTKVIATKTSGETVLLTSNQAD